MLKLKEIASPFDFMEKDKFYITTSIAYTNALPHLGYALELVQADVLARFNRSLGRDVFFLTGTDEHGAKISKAAKTAGKTEKELTDSISSKFKELTEVLNVSNDDFIRTTDEVRHWPTVGKVWQTLKEKGDIYKKKYQGLYCVGCEAFVTQKDLVDGKCAIHKKEPEKIEEENYFFRLSKYSKQILEDIEAGRVSIIPEGRKNEMMSFIKQGLEDVSFSRPRKDLKWGVQVPDDDSQTVYVWADALVNYLSALDYPEGGRFKRFWPPDIHCVGKDILRFHAVIWLGVLLSLGLELPRKIFVHGFITSDGQKMSKSLGNVVDPFELVKKYGSDAVRYFLLREISATEDGDFSFKKFEERYNFDLASGLGNIVARVITLSGGLKPAIKNSELENKIEETEKKYQEKLNEFKFSESLAIVWELIGFCDKYIEEEKPWQKSEKQKEVISNLLFVVEKIAGIIGSFFPKTSEKILKQLKAGEKENLFPRI